MHVIQGNQIWAKRIEIWHCCYIIPAVAQSCCMEAFDSFLCTEIRIRPEIYLLWMSISAYFLLVLSVFSLWRMTVDSWMWEDSHWHSGPFSCSTLCRDSCGCSGYKASSLWRPRCLWQSNVICDGDMRRARGIPVTVFRANFSLDWKVG